MDKLALKNHMIGSVIVPLNAARVSAGSDASPWVVAFAVAVLICLIAAIIISTLRDRRRRKR